MVTAQLAAVPSPVIVDPCRSIQHVRVTAAVVVVVVVATVRVSVPIVPVWIPGAGFLGRDRADRNAHNDQHCRK